MKNLKSLFSIAMLMLVMLAGCENSTAPPGSFIANEEKIQSDKTAITSFNTVIKLKPGENAFFDENLPFETFNNLKIKNIPSNTESCICSEIIYRFNAQNFTGYVHQCIIGGEEIIRLDEGLFDLDIKNVSGSVLKLEVSIYQ